jgi:hypothetical protein
VLSRRRAHVPTLGAGGTEWHEALRIAREHQFGRFGHTVPSARVPFRAE